MARFHDCDTSRLVHLRHSLREYLQRAASEARMRDKMAGTYAAPGKSTSTGRRAEGVGFYCLKFSMMQPQYYVGMFSDYVEVC